MLEIILSVLAGMSYVFLSATPGNQFPAPLEKSVEAELFRKMSEDGDREARTKLISHNLRLVAHIVRKYYPGNPAGEDLISIGTIGLIKAIDSFNSKNGARFATYGAKCIQNEILMYFRSQKKTAQDVSLSDYIETGTDGAALSLMDVVSEDGDLLETVSAKERLIQVRRAVQECLTDQERQVILLRYGLGGLKPSRQREVAQMLGISRSYVSHHAYCKR